MAGVFFMRLASFGSVVCACAVREARNSSSPLAAIAQNLRRLAKLVVRPPPVTEACFAQGA
jgi:hypothetical protein